MPTDSPIGLEPISSTTTAVPGPALLLGENELVLAYTDSLARYLPNDELFSAKYIKGSNLRSLLSGLSRRIIQGDQFIFELLDEYIPDNTVQFLDEWEVVLGIPDDCFSGTGTTLARRTAILVKLASLGVQTSDDFVALAAIFGLSVNVYPGLDVFNDPSLAPGLVVATERRARYTIVVTYNLDAGAAFPYVYPIPFGSDAIIVLECLFNKIKPANCIAVFQSV